MFHHCNRGKLSVCLSRCLTAAPAYLMFLSVVLTYADAMMYLLNWHEASLHDKLLTAYVHSLLTCWIILRRWCEVQGLTLEAPEVVPFRLTQNLVDGFGASGVEGVYRKSCEVTLQVDPSPCNSIFMSWMGLKTGVASSKELFYMRFHVDVLPPNVPDMEWGAFESRDNRKRLQGQSSSGSAAVHLTEMWYSQARSLHGVY